MRAPVDVVSNLVEIYRPGAYNTLKIGYMWFVIDTSNAAAKR